jgi:hypothetical protein
MTELQRLMGELDAVLTGKSFKEATGQFHHYPHTLEKWLEDVENLVWYLSDSGYSRVYYSQEQEQLFLTYNSTDRVKARWGQAQPQRQAVESFIKAEFQRLGV